MPMTDQEIFDKVATHLLTQGQRSKSRDALPHLPGTLTEAQPRCRYRGDEGRMCAVGCLITDEAYHYSIEGRGATYSTVVAALVKSGVMSGVTVSGESGLYTPTEQLLERLQGVHDSYDPEDWLLNLRETAAQMELSDAVLAAFNKGADHAAS